MTTFTDHQGRIITIRPPQASDLDQVTRLINELSQENTYIRFSGEVLTHAEEGEWLASVLEKIAQGDYAMLLAFDGDQLVGSTTIERDTSTAKRSLHAGIFGIVIARDYRGAGLGEELMQRIIEEANTTMPHLRLIRLNVFAPNEPAFHLYQKFGFVEVGRLPEYILHRGEYIDEIVMIKKLV